MEKEIRISDLNGLLVVALEEGIQLGKVTDVYFDRPNKQVAGISFKKRIGIGREFYVDRDDIKKLGIDVIIVSSEKSARPLPEKVSGIGLKKIKELVAMSNDGSKIGKISDLIVSGNDDRKISALILDRKKKLEIGASELTLGEDAILVPPNYLDRIKEVETESSGTSSRYLTEAAYLGETVKDTVQSVVESVKKTTGKLGDSVKETSDKATATFKVTSEKMGDTVRKKFKKNTPETTESEKKDDRKPPPGEPEFPPHQEAEIKPEQE